MAGAWQQSQERAPNIKEMTRQHTDCISMFSTKFIKNYFMYSCVNAGILHTGSNQHNEPVNLMSKIGWRVAHFLPNWEVLTQDQWVLQTVADYHLELTEAPTQAKVPQQMKCSQESKSQIDSKLQELLSKGAVVETQVSPGNFVS